MHSSLSIHVQDGAVIAYALKPRETKIQVQLNSPNKLAREIQSQSGFKLLTFLDVRKTPWSKPGGSRQCFHTRAEDLKHHCYATVIVLATFRNSECFIASSVSISYDRALATRVIPHSMPCHQTVAIATQPVTRRPPSTPLSVARPSASLSTIVAGSTRAMSQCQVLDRVK
jgi:hypothetical protein